MTCFFTSFKYFLVKPFDSRFLQVFLRFYSVHIILEKEGGGGENMIFWGNIYPCLSSALKNFQKVLWGITELDTPLLLSQSHFNIQLHKKVFKDVKAGGGGSRLGSMEIKILPWNYYKSLTKLS